MSAQPPPMRLRVDTDDPTPPFEQLRRQLEQAIRFGSVAPGQRLPPIRQLAGDLGLAVGTVARAYRELESADLVTGARGGGTRVQNGAHQISATERTTVLGQLTETYVADARRLGVSNQDVSEAITRALR